MLILVFLLDLYDLTYTYIVAMKLHACIIHLSNINIPFELIASCFVTSLHNREHSAMLYITNSTHILHEIL